MNDHVDDNDDRTMQFVLEESWREFPAIISSNCSRKICCSHACCRIYHMLVGKLFFFYTYTYTYALRDFPKSRARENWRRKIHVTEREVVDCCATSINIINSRGDRGQWETGVNVRRFLQFNDRNSSCEFSDRKGKREKKREIERLDTMRQWQWTRGGRHLRGQSYYCNHDFYMRVMSREEEKE